MANDEQQIRTLIENWADAVRRGDMDGVLANHSRDIVMFDVPPPYEGARGIDAYRETWPQFFEWHALLRCGTQRDLADNPELRLRLTIGLRKEDGRWVVAHEHHSYPDLTAGNPD